MRAKLWEQLHNTLFLWQNWRGGCWEHEIEEEREEGERKSERVSHKGDGRKRLRRVRRKK